MQPHLLRNIYMLQCSLQTDHTLVPLALKKPSQNSKERNSSKLSGSRPENSSFGMFLYVKVPDDLFLVYIADTWRTLLHQIVRSGQVLQPVLLELQ